MALLDAGLTATLSREFARKDNSKEEKNRIFKTLESSYFILVTVCIIVVFSLSNFIAYKWLNLSTQNPEKVSLYFKIISFDIGFQLLLRFYIGGLLGLEEQVKANFYQVGWGILRNGLVIILIIFYPYLEFFFLWQAFSTLFFVILIKLALNKSLNGNYVLDLKLGFEKEVFEKVWKFAGGMLLISLVAGLNSQLDKLSISKLLSVESLGYYTLSISVASVIIASVNPISVAALPRFTALFSAGKIKEASTLFYKIILIVAILVFSVMGNIIFWGEEIIWVWTGKFELAEHTSEILPIMAISYSMLAIVTIPFNIAIANGYTILNNLLGLTSLFLTLPGYWIATKSFGATGAASVFCLVQTMITIIYIYFIDIKFLKTIRPVKVYIKNILFPLLISLIIAYLFSLLSHFYHGNRFLSLAIIGLSIIITLLMTTIIFVPKEELRKEFSNLKKQIIK